MDQSLIEELIGGMPSWTDEANCKGQDADLFFQLMIDPHFTLNKLHVCNL